jgi:potassium-transporting ATPase KdpC subunit
LMCSWCWFTWRLDVAHACPIQRGNIMIKLINQSIRQTILWSLVAGLMYPLVMTLFAQVAFHHQANGSLVEQDGKVIGSVWLAQQFQGTNYFWPRPSACSYGTGPTGIAASSGSNLGPTSGALHTNVMNNIAAFISGNNLPTNTVVPADMVYASASGLDPHISPEAARLQIARVAASRGLGEDKIKALVEQFTEPPQWGFLGQARVNVLLLNVALDHAQAGMKKAESSASTKG